jgi:hypothetical protein
VNINPKSTIRVTARGKNANASFPGSPQRQARWQNIKWHDGRTVRSYLYNAGKLGYEALRRRIRDGWVELDESDKRQTADGSYGQHDISALMTKQKAFIATGVYGGDTRSIISFRCLVAAHIGQRTFGSLVSPATAPRAI